MARKSTRPIAELAVGQLFPFKIYCDSVRVRSICSSISSSRRFSWGLLRILQFQIYNELLTLPLATLFAGRPTLSHIRTKLS